MLSTISWGNYLITILVLTAVWYVFVIFYYYSEDVKGIFSEQSKGIFLLRSKNIENIEVLFSEEIQSSKSDQDQEDLSILLVKAIEESYELNFSNEELKSHLKLILHDYPQANKPSERIQLNKLMVSECEKHPQLILTYAEVDGLWG